MRKEGGRWIKRGRREERKKGGGEKSCEEDPIIGGYCGIITLAAAGIIGLSKSSRTPSFLPSFHPSIPSPRSHSKPLGRPPITPPRSFTADSTRLAAIEIVSRPDIVVFLATCRYETSTRLLIKRSFEGGIVGEGLRSRIVLLVSTVR